MLSGIFRTFLKFVSVGSRNGGEPDICLCSGIFRTCIDMTVNKDIIGFFAVPQTVTPCIVRFGIEGLLRIPGIAGICCFGAGVFEKKGPCRLHVTAEFAVAGNGIQIIIVTVRNFALGIFYAAETESVAEISCFLSRTDEKWGFWLE